MEEGTIVSWSKKEGESVSAGDVLCEVETDKATMDYEATQEGTLLKIIQGDGSTAKVGEVIGIIGEEGEDIAALVEEAASAGSATKEDDVSADTGQAPPTENATAEPAAEPADAAAPAGGDAVKASPLARTLAADRGFDIAQIPGSGPGGRVVKRDVESFRGATRSASGATGAAATPLAPASDQKVPVSSRRAVIAKRLAESKFSAPHYYLKRAVRMESAIGARAMLNKELPEKASFNAFLIKFVAEALKRHPNVNASWQGDHILQFGSIDIGLAVDLGNGLITPVVRNCGNRGIADIDAELKALITKAGEGKLQPEEYTGAGFTISNLGSFGIDEFTAIINPPGSAILAVGRVQKEVIVGEDDELDVVQQMVMTLSCDHRVVDGAAGARFMNELAGVIENPVRALF